MYGLLIGLITFIIIGAFHPLVTKGEYYCGVKIWWGFLAAGIVAMALAVIADSVLWQAVWGVLSFSSLWSIHEVFEQRERVRKGWFPKNPRRKYPF
jgi:branched-subunit amino acid transport protein